jgi:hypothetical protein
MEGSWIGVLTVKFVLDAGLGCTQTLNGWASDWFSPISWREQVNFQWDEDAGLKCRLNKFICNVHEINLYWRFNRLIKFIEICATQYPVQEHS